MHKIDDAERMIIRIELRQLFQKNGVESNNTNLLNDIADLVGHHMKSAEKANDAVNEFFAQYNVENPDFSNIQQEIQSVRDAVYKIVWQS